MIRSLADLFMHEGSKVERACVVSDLRGGDYFEALAEVLDELDARRVAHRVLFLEADEESCSPATGDAPAPSAAPDGSVADGIDRERELLAPIRERADASIDTTGLSAAALRRKVAAEMLAPREPGRLALTFESFGLKHGPARDADLGARRPLPAQPALGAGPAPADGLDRRIVEYVGRDGRLKEFYERVVPLLEYLLPQYVAEGKAHLVVAIGCTGGRHRSVVIAEDLGARFRERRPLLRRGRAPRRGSRRPVRSVAGPGYASRSSPFSAEERVLTAMPVRVGINGFGRIGRNVFRAAHESERRRRDRRRQRPHRRRDARAPAQVRLGLRAVPRHGRGRRRRAHGRRQGGHGARGARPGELPWGDLGVDVVIESTGFFTKRATPPSTSTAGAKKVIISAPATEPDATVVLGVNFDDVYDPDNHDVISNASCTTNCLAPVAKVLQRRDRHRARADDDDPRLHGRPAPAGRAAQRPAPRARGRDQPRADLDRRREGDRPGHPRAQGQAERLRGPRARPDRLGRRPHLRGRARDDGREIKELVRGKADTGALAGILAYTEDPIVSSDIVKNPYSSIFDAELTSVLEGELVKVVAWYDNEWGYSNRCVDLAQRVLVRAHA